MSKAAANTPLIQQYLDIKARHPDSILFFRVGDFYEMFFEDAEEGSRLLGITLTSRNNGGSGDVPLAGVPAKAIDDYLPQLVRQGRRVAICEQVEDPSEADGIVRREVTEIVTPGATLEDSLLSAGRNNFVAAVAGTGPVGIATADLSTGEVDVRECVPDALADELSRIEPAEVVQAAGSDLITAGPWVVTEREGWRFAPDVAAETVKRLYRVRDVAGFGLEVEGTSHMLGAVGAVLGYLEEVRPGGTGHLKAPRVERSGRYLYLDEMTRRNLEVVESIRDASGATLLQILDRTLTPMGRRMLRRRLLAPLVRSSGHQLQAGGRGRASRVGWRPTRIAGIPAPRAGSRTPGRQDLCRQGQRAGAPRPGAIPRGSARDHRSGRRSRRRLASALSCVTSMCSTTSGTRSKRRSTPTRPR